MVSKRKIIFVVTEDWYFVSHRLPLAAHLHTQGWEVIVATKVNATATVDTIRRAGVRVEAIAVRRGAIFSPYDISYMRLLRRLYRRERPDIVHHVAMKPVLYGSLAAIGCRKVGVVNALAGLGFLFTSSRPLVAVLRQVTLVLFRFLHSRSNARLILQNAEDMRLFTEVVGVPRDKITIVRGVGIQLRGVVPVQHGCRLPPVALFVGRMLKDKGVLELVEAARILKRRNVPIVVRLAGDVDAANPNTLSAQQLHAFVAEGVVEWLGHRRDVDVLYRETDMAVLPSYREGLPKSLLEAAAFGLPIVTTDTSGCREVVEQGTNGFLVPVRDSSALASAMETLTLDPRLRRTFGTASRRRAEQEFEESIIFAQMDRVYNDILKAQT